MLLLDRTGDKEGIRGRLYSQMKLHLRLGRLEGSGLHGGWIKSAILLHTVYLQIRKGISNDLGGNRLGL